MTTRLTALSLIAVALLATTTAWAEPPPPAMGLAATDQTATTGQVSADQVATTQAATALPLPGHRPDPPPRATAPTPTQAQTRREIAEARIDRCSEALGGNRETAFRMAKRHLFGIGTRRNPRTGASWLRVAAAMGHPEARRLLIYVPSALGRLPPVCSGGVGSRWSPDVLSRRNADRPPPAVIRQMVERLAPTYGLDPALVLTVIRIESDFQPETISPKAAAGLMQLIPATAERFGVNDVFDAEDNVRGGMKYLRWLLSYFRGDVILATAAYNAGEGAVDRYSGVPPYAETQNYVRLIRAWYGPERHAFDPNLTNPSPLIARNRAVNEPTPRPAPRSSRG